MLENQEPCESRSSRTVLGTPVVKFSRATRQLQTIEHPLIEEIRGEVETTQGVRLDYDKLDRMGYGNRFSCMPAEENRRSLRQSRLA